MNHDMARPTAAAACARAGKKMVLRVRKRPGMEADDVLAPPPAAGGGSVWGKLLGGGSKAQDGVQM